MGSNSSYNPHRFFDDNVRHSGMQITRELIGKYVRRTAPHRSTGDRSYMEEIFYVIAVSSGYVTMLNMDTRYSGNGRNKRTVELALSEYQDGAWEMVETFTGDPAIDYAIKILKAADVSPEAYAEMLRRK